MINLKASDNKTTLLKYIIGLMETSQPELLNFVQDLPNLNQASRMSFGILFEEVAALKKKYRKT